MNDTLSMGPTGSSHEPELTEDEKQFIADHLAACAAYIEHLDDLWIGDDEQFSATSTDSIRIETDQTVEELSETPPIPADTALKLQNKVRKSIQRGDLTANAVQLGTQGLMEVLLAMIRPILSDNRNKRDRK